MHVVPVVLVASLLACVAVKPAQASPSAQSGPYTMELVDEHGAQLPTYVQHGRTYVLGLKGQRYAVRIRNGSWRRVEAVVSVDGRDVLDGRPASSDKRGYLVDARGEVLIDGFRLSEASVAAFRFSDVSSSYAARMGNARDVGVIGVAVFPERVRPVPHRRYPLGSGSADERSRSSAGTGSGAGKKSAPSSAPEARADASAAERPGLGTEFGEERSSAAYSVHFERQNRFPSAMLTARYNDRDGLLALGIDVDGARYSARDERWLRETAEPFRNGPYSRPPPGWNR
jgi:hypothetical protein